MTAEAVCFFRAAEHRRLDRVLVDPWSERFLGASASALLRFGPGRRLAHRFRGLGTTIALRHRYFDDLVETALRDGVENVLLLGAGYDTRCWRFADRIGRGTFWEVDHPATAAAKAAVASHLPTAPVQRLVTDFQSRRTEDVLRDGGFPVGARAAVVWEGVTMYLHRAAVVDTLDAIRRAVGPGSVLGVDFWRAPSRAIERVHAGVLGLIGEPLTFPLHPDALPALVEPLGWRVTDIADAPALAARRAVARSVYPASWMATLLATESP